MACVLTSYQDVCIERDKMNRQFFRKILMVKLLNVADLFLKSPYSLLHRRFSLLVNSL